MRFVALAAAAAALWIQPAQAATVLYTFTGTVKSGVDQLGIFGAAGTALDGLAYTAVYTLDTDKGYVESYHAPYGAPYGYPNNIASISGAGPYPEGNPVTATLTLNGVQVQFDSDGYGSIAFRNTLPASKFFYDRLSADVSGITDPTLKYAYMSNQVGSAIDFLPGQSFADPINWSFQPKDLSEGYLGFTKVISGTEVRTTARLSPTSLVVAYVPGSGPLPEPLLFPRGLPEPSTWVMLIFGIGLTGAALRRRQGLAVTDIVAPNALS